MNTIEFSKNEFLFFEPAGKKTFQRFHYEKGITLKDMKNECISTLQGLCVHRIIDKLGITDTPFMKEIGVKDETGEVLILEGDICGICHEGYRIFPTRIVDRVSVVCVGDHWEKSQNNKE